MRREEWPEMLQSFDAILKHLNANSGAYTVVFTLFVAAATVMYAVLTNTLVAETRRMRERQTEPDLSIAAVPSREWLNWINMEIANVGAGSAHNIRLQVEPDFENRPGEWLSRLGPFKNGIKHLPPGSKVSFFVMEMVGKDSEKRRNSEFTIRAEYQNGEGTSVRREFPISLSYMEGLMAIDKDPLIGLREHAATIAQTVTKWAEAARSEIDHRMWVSENYYFKSQIGTFWIRQIGRAHV